MPNAAWISTDEGSLQRKIHQVCLDSVSNICHLLGSTDVWQLAEWLRDYYGDLNESFYGKFPCIQRDGISCLYYLIVDGNDNCFINLCSKILLILQQRCYTGRCIKKISYL